MARELGVSFSPSGGEDRQATQGAPRGGSPIQDAIKTISLRIPKFAGSGPVGAGAPNALLQGPGGAGLSAQLGAGGPSHQAGMGPMNLQQFLQAIFSGMGQPGMGGGMGSMGGGQSSPFSFNPSASQAQPNVNFGVN